MPHKRFYTDRGFHNTTQCSQQFITAWMIYRLVYIVCNIQSRKLRYIRGTKLLFHDAQSFVVDGYRLTHWGRVTHICVSKLTIIGSDNGLSPGRRQAIFWTNNGILLIRTFRTPFSEIVSEIHTFSFKKMHFKMSSGKWRPSCLGLNVLIHPVFPRRISLRLALGHSGATEPVPVQPNIYAHGCLPVLYFSELPNLKQP